MGIRYDAATGKIFQDLGGTTSVLGGIGSLLSPLGYISSFAGFVGDRMDKAEQRRLLAEAAYNTALADMRAQGVDPTEIYSPANIAANMTDYSWADNPNLTYEDLSGQAVRSAIDDYISQQGGYDAYVQRLTSPIEYARDVADTASDILNDPSRVLGVIFGPGGVTGNIEVGGGTMKNVPGTSTAVYTGSPAPGVLTGVDTGSDVINAAIRRVLGQTEGGETTTWDVILEGVAKASGYPVDKVAKILKDSGVNVPSPNAPSTGGTGSTTTTTTGGVTTTPDTTGGTYVGVGNNSGESIFDKIMDILRNNKTDEEKRTAAENAGVTPEDIAKATNTPIEEVQRRWDEAGGGGLETVTGGKGNDVLETVTGGNKVLETGGESDVVLGSPYTPTITTETPKSDVNEPGALDVVPSTTVLNVPPAGREHTAGGGGGSPAYDALMPEYQTVTTTPGDLALIDYLYDVGGESIFAPMQEQESEEDKRLARIRDLNKGSYAQGGPVDIVGLALQLLRG